MEGSLMRSAWICPTLALRQDLEFIPIIYLKYYTDSPKFWNYALVEPPPAEQAVRPAVKTRWPNKVYLHYKALIRDLHPYASLMEDNLLRFERFAGDSCHYPLSMGSNPRARLSEWYCSRCV